MCDLRRRLGIETEGKTSESVRGRERACAGEREERREIRMNPSCDLVVCVYVCVCVCVLRSGESPPLC